MLARAIDTDNYDGPVAIEDFQDLHDNSGVMEAIVGCQVGRDGANYTEIQRDNARAGGLVVRFHYDFLYWANGDLERMKAAAGFGLPVYIDEETVAPGWSSGQIVERIAQAKDVLIAEGLFGGHYTNPGWWQTWTGNSQLFAGDPLWLATWPYGNGVLPPIDFLPNLIPGSVSIGGMILQMQQYADVCYAVSNPKTRPPGNFDLNVVSLPDPAPPAPPAPYLVRMERTDHFSDGSSYVVTAAYDPPPWATK